MFARDVLNPRIYLKGPNPARIELGSSYEDYGATAYSSNSSSTGRVALSVTSNGAVNANEAGQYTITYSAVDADGRSIEEKRIVLVYEPISLSFRNSKIPQTGDTRVFYELDDAYYHSGTNRSYTRDDANEIVVDNTNELIWQDSIESKTLELAWLDARNYCLNSTMGEITSWRLPTKFELAFLVDFNRAEEGRPLIDTAFQNTQANEYWASSGSVTIGGSNAYYDVDFSNGHLSANGLTATQNFRCVSGAVKYIPLFKNKNNIVVDTQNNLMWQDNPEAETVLLDWQSALHYCKNLTTNGASDWRLPNVNEYRTIISELNDFGGSQFKHRNYHDPYWTSSTSSEKLNSFDAINRAWAYANFINWPYETRKTNENNVRCVRDYAAPVAVIAEGDQTIQEGESVFLNAVGSHDPDGTIVSYEWSVYQGSRIILSTERSFTSNHAFNPGVNEITLTVTDNNGIKSTDKTNLIVEETPLVADAGQDQTNNQGVLIKLDASNSTSSSSVYSLWYDWYEGDRFLARGRSVQRFFPAGAHTVTLKLTALYWGAPTKVSTDEVIITIIPNELPIARAGQDQTVPESSTVTLNASNSTDSDGSIVSYEWKEDFGGDPNNDIVLSTYATFSKSDFSLGRHGIELTVTDDKGASAIDYVIITVGEGSANNELPIARAGQDQTVPESSTVTLNASNSTDSDGSIVSYEWKEGSVILSRSVTFDRSDFFTGEHTIVLTITDNNGGIATDSILITITPTANVPPIADSQTLNLEEDSTVEFTLTGSDANAGSSLTYTMLTQPAHGNIVNNGTVLGFIYTPDPNYYGNDSLTFKINDGELDSNTATINLNIASVNDAPVANAGYNQAVIVGRPVTLDASGTSDDSNTVTYEWKEGDVVLSTAESFSTSALSIGIHVIQLKATDSEGLSGIDTVEIVVNEIPPPGVNISPVLGNTATYNSIAEFSVSLKNKPGNDVIIPVSSSDETEGVPAVSNLIFTPDNWSRPQIIKVEGRNQNVIDGIQNYQIILSSVQSLDLNYHGFDPADVDMKGIFLSLSVPTESSVFVSEIEQSLKIPTIYTGSKTLTYSLQQEPEGMTINSDGYILWEPLSSMDGNTYTITVSATDGDKNAGISFNVRVFETSTAMQTVITGRTLKMADNTVCNFTGITGLSEFSITVPEGSEPLLTNVALYKNTNITPDLPENTEINSCVFKIKGLPANDNNYVVTLPAYNLGVDKAFEQIGLYRYEQLPEGNSWSGGWSKGTLLADGKLQLEVTTNQLEGLFFIGHKNYISQPNQQARLQSRVLTTANKAVLHRVNNNYCAKGKSHYFDSILLPIIERETDLLHHCTRPSDNFSATIYNFGVQRWQASVEDLFQWMLDAKNKVDELGLSIANTISVDIDDKRKSMNAGVYTDTLYLSGDNTYIEKVMVNQSRDPELIKKAVRFAVVHELFHLVQKNTMDFATWLSVRLPLIADNGIWMVEGTATWFEDEVYDDENPYEFLVDREGDSILETGLVTRHDFTGSIGHNGYKAFSFYKLVNGRCSKFSMKKFLQGNWAYAGEDIRKLTDAFGEGCEFGDYLGADKKSSLEAALFYYQYATQYRNNMSLLDFNESRAIFHFYTRDTEILGAAFLEENGKVRSIPIDTKVIPANGAKSFWVHKSIFDGNKMDLDNYARGGSSSVSEEAVFRVKTSEDLALTISVLRLPTEDEPYEKGEAPIVNGSAGNHKYYKTDEICDSEFVFDYNEITQLQPNYFITLVNPHPTPVHINELTFEIRDARYFRDDQKDVVYSRGYELMWQDIPENIDKKLNFAEAVQYCENLNHSGFQDWYNPNLFEWWTFLDRSDLENYNGLHNPNTQKLFKYVKENHTEQATGFPLTNVYWASEANADLNNLNSIYGDSSFWAPIGLTEAEGIPAHVRCVRKTTSNMCYKN